MEACADHAACASLVTDVQPRDDLPLSSCGCLQFQDSRLETCDTACLLWNKWTCSQSLLPCCLMFSLLAPTICQPQQFQWRGSQLSIS